MNGVISILKPPGMTSHDVVAYLRKVTGIKKIGHTGTLDPGAAGVLPICIGKSTKIVDYLMDDRKIYICELTLGNKTDTYDKYGSFIDSESANIEGISKVEIHETIRGFKGEIFQKPPAYSAIKIDGRRAYDLAREGIDVDIPERKVIIYNIDVLNIELPRIMIKIECSKGTYIRSICNDIGDKLGCGGYMSFLIRTQTGKFNLKNSYILEEIKKETIDNMLVSPDHALNMESVYIDKSFEAKVLNGNQIKLDVDSSTENNQPLKVFISPDNFVGIGRIRNSLLHIDKLLK
jgi:tRNA pseudouridine55 synthase